MLHFSLQVTVTLDYKLKGAIHASCFVNNHLCYGAMYILKCAQLSQAPNNIGFPIILEAEVKIALSQTEGGPKTIFLIETMAKNNRLGKVERIHGEYFNHM